MERRIFKSAALVACISLSASVAESPPNDDAGTVDFSGLIKRPASSEVVAVLAWGEHTIFRNIQRQTTFIRRVATEAERRIAEQNAKAYFAQLSQTQKAEIKKKKRYWAVPIKKAKPPPPPRPRVPKKEPEEEPEPPPSEEIMIYDPLSSTLVNKYVYTITNMPPPDTPMALEGYEPVLFVGR